MTETKSPVTVTRAELHARVWAEPMNLLGPAFGLSGNCLKNICERHDIPIPPRGYWAKKAAGQRVAKFRLPVAERTPAETIIIRPSPPPAPKPVVQEPPEDMAHIVVAARLGKAHPVIRAWREHHSQETKVARASSNDWSRVTAPVPWSEMDRRRHRILDALFKALGVQVFGPGAGEAKKGIHARNPLEICGGS